MLRMLAIPSQRISLKGCSRVLTRSLHELMDLVDGEVDHVGQLFDGDGFEVV